MRKFLAPQCLLAGIAVLTIGCASTSRTMVSRARPAINPANVRVYERAPRSFEPIALVEGNSIGELRAEAAAVGANGLVVRGVIQRPSPVIGLGIGTGGFSVGRRGGVGIGTGLSLAAPLGGGEVLEAEAIYVP